jgi:hypothetical protein
MSFNLSKIKLNSKEDTIGDEIKVFFRKLGANNKLTPKVKKEIRKYTYVIIRMRYKSSFSLEEILNVYLVELLENCCYKPYEKINQKDVILNEKEIIYEIEKSLKYNNFDSMMYKEQEYDKMGKPIY